MAPLGTAVLASDDVMVLSIVFWPAIPCPLLQLSLIGSGHGNSPKGWGSSLIAAVKGQRKRAAWHFVTTRRVAKRLTQTRV
jgi:hypothetical protein